MLAREAGELSGLASCTPTNQPGPTQTPDPLAINPPWEIQVRPWNTIDSTHPRYGLIVGYLYYRGTKGTDPKQYAGAFDIRWADMPATQWTVRRG